MSCPVCNTSPCVCGDSYYKLTDEGFLSHLSVIKKIAIDRKLDIKMLINNIDIDDYINNLNIVIDSNVSLTTMLNNFVNVPTYYKEILDKYKGRDVLNMMFEISHDFDIIDFPLLIAVYRLLTRKENSINLLRGLTYNFYNKVVNINYELEKPLGPYMFEDFIKATRDINRFNEILYKQTNMYEMRLRELKDVDAPQYINTLKRYRDALSHMSNIVKDGNKNCIYDAMKFMCVTVPNGSSIAKQFEETQMITNSMRDELQSANYAFSDDYDLLITGDLKV